MSTLLLDEPLGMFQKDLAEEIGLNEAIFLQELHYWVQRSKHIFDGKQWVYNTQADWIENHFPFWSVRTLQRITANLRKLKLVLTTDKHNKFNIDRKLWYAIDYEVFKAIREKIAKRKAEKRKAIEDAKTATSGTRQSVVLSDDTMAASGYRQGDGSINDTMADSTTEITGTEISTEISNTTTVVVADNAPITVDVPGLLKQYFSETYVEELRANHTDKYLLEKIFYLQFEMSEREVRKASGWLRRAIEENYKKPEGYRSPEEIAEEEQKEKLEREEREQAYTEQDKLRREQREKEEEAQRQEERRVAHEVEVINETLTNWRNELDFNCNELISLWQASVSRYESRLEHSIYIVGFYESKLVLAATPQDYTEVTSNGDYIISAVVERFSKQTNITGYEYSLAEIEIPSIDNTEVGKEVQTDEE